MGKRKKQPAPEPEPTNNTGTALVPYDPPGEVIDADFEVRPDPGEPEGLKDSEEPKEAKEPEDLEQEDPKSCLDEIAELERECQEAETAFEKAKKAAKEAREFFDLKVSELRKAIRAISTPMPLYEPKNGQQTAPINPDLESVLEAESDQDQAEQDEEALATPLSEVFAEAGLSEAITSCFYRKNLQTVGDLAKWTAAEPWPGAGYNNELHDLEGIGDVKAEKVEEALEKFWEKRRRR